MPPLSLRHYDHCVCEVALAVEDNVVDAQRKYSSTWLRLLVGNVLLGLYAYRTPFSIRKMSEAMTVALLFFRMSTAC